MVLFALPASVSSIMLAVSPDTLFDALTPKSPPRTGLGDSCGRGGDENPLFPTAYLLLLVSKLVALRYVEPPTDGFIAGGMFDRKSGVENVLKLVDPIFWRSRSRACRCNCNA